MAVKVVCDFCDRPLEFDSERDSYVLYRTKKIDTRKLFPHLCKSCAEKLNMVANIKPGINMTRRAIIERYKKLNQEHRDKLGTKG